MKIRLPKTKNSNKQEVIINHSKDMYPIMQNILLRENKLGRNKEHVWIISLNPKKVLLNIELISLGTNKSTIISPTNVYQLAVHKEATGIIMVHNHPSQTLKPSTADKDITDHMIKVGEILKINFLDHLIITEADYYSFFDEKLLQELQKSTKYTLDFIQEERIREEATKFGKLLGIQEGKEEGKIIGEKTGEKRGEMKEKVKVAKKMLKKKMNIKAICEFTGLNKKEIEKLK
jgi:DNA repair protein RadC